MRKGPQGQWRRADPVACAVHVGRIATGEIQETVEAPRDTRADLADASRRASVAAKARAANLTSERRREIARDGATARWSK